RRTFYRRSTKEKLCYMRLPQLLQESQFFLFSGVEELLSALGSVIDPAEKQEVLRLADLGLPPISSKDALATMLGINPGLLWSFENRPQKHYRVFTIPKGAGRERTIVAPKVALKVLQKWLSIQLQRNYVPPNHVFGFIPGRSHIQAAQKHLCARWTYSVDIENFFPTTSRDVVCEVFLQLGYSPESSQMLAGFCCYKGFLAQGAPTSPVVSNLAFRNIDERLVQLAERFGVRLSRYADDIVFSGIHDFPDELRIDVDRIFGDSPWRLSPDKTEFDQLPRRLKVHGLLVHGERVRLTKGYRNKLRAYAAVSLYTS
ncbi:reverse transcriptase family protein, partial [Stenotrophomonas nitritireducens]|uniref:reverse transcriptase family protein n=1 Tax=Stenotrophomonas nitritireducens TaxID=83617 RepID=UPI000A91DC5C